jgi:hypothetical protein
MTHPSYYTYGDLNESDREHYEAVLAAAKAAREALWQLGAFTKPNERATWQACETLVDAVVGRETAKVMTALTIKRGT